MKVLVCPLDWGLGHATRSIPLVRALVRNGHEVILGASGGGLSLLREEFPELEIFDFPGYPVRYSRTAAGLLPVLLAQLPGLLRSLAREKEMTERLVTERGIQVVLSDGRYGVRSRRVPSILVTHQVFLRVPGRFPGAARAERLVHALNLRFLRRFQEVWVPDFPGERNLSGALSHRPRDLESLRFIGPLSRFLPADHDWQTQPPAGASGPAVDVLASVSGPEPQRSRFETELRRALGDMSGTRVLVLGRPSDASIQPPEETRIAHGELNVFPHLDGAVLETLFRSAALVVARSGYTTVMEMASLGLGQAVLVPTPGQSEQEYLAEHLDRTGVALRMDQDVLDLVEAQRRLGRYVGFGAFRGPGMGATTTSMVNWIAEHPIFRTPE